MPYSLRHVLRCLSFLVFAVLCALPTLGALGQEKKLKELKWSHAFDLACRKFGEADITEKTKKWGVEAFLDDNSGLGLYISQTGSMSVAPHFKNLSVPLNPSKGPKWLTGLDMPARKAGVREFMKTTKVHSMEVFRDPNTDDWLFITELGNIAATDGKLFPGAANPNHSPKWLHSVDLAVRKGGVKEWKDAAKFGIEIYYDGNSGNLVYVTEAGNIAIIPGGGDEVKAKAPDWLHGLDLSCRKFSEKSFTKDTLKFGVEVYHDTTTGNLIFISETGSISVTAAPTTVKAPTVKAREPEWTHGLNIRCREFGEKTFSDKTRAFGAEVFVDENIGATIYINELGIITASAAK